MNRFVPDDSHDGLERCSVEANNCNLTIVCREHRVAVRRYCASGRNEGQTSRLHRRAIAATLLTFLASRLRP